MIHLKQCLLLVDHTSLAVYLCFPSTILLPDAQQTSVCCKNNATKLRQIDEKMLDDVNYKLRKLLKTLGLGGQMY